jgi:hypothetical protein
MKLEIHQTENMDLRITGGLYLNDGYFVIADDRIVDVQYDNILRDCTAESNGYGFLLVPGTIRF